MATASIYKRSRNRYNYLKPPSKMNKQIKSEDVLKVIKNFEKVLPKAKKEKNLDMNIGSVDVCKTAHCHGGWYTVAKINPLRRIITKMNYIEGANIMAKDLGLKSRVELQNWANDNPNIWGNNYGLLMFQSNGRVAFKSSNRPSGAYSLKEIIDHWKEVYERIKATEETEERKDITHELAVLPPAEVSDQKVKENVKL